MQYTRNDLAFTRGTFRVRGDTVEIIPVYEELAIRIEFFGDEIERIYTLHPLTGEIVREEQEMYVFPATHYVAGPERMERAIRGIELELEDQLARVREAGQAARGPAAAHAHDLRHRDDAPGRVLLRHRELLPAHRRPRPAARRPTRLLDYFPEDFLLVIDESHVTVPQIGAMYEGDMSRKRDAGRPRLPAARAPWTTARCGGRSSSSGSARPSTCPRRPGTTSWPRPTASSSRSSGPTGLVDPEVVLKPTKGQIDDLLHEIRDRAGSDERVLVTTLTKKMAEDLTDYLLEQGVRVRYLHCEVDTLRRVELLRELRMGEFDVLVGINLLREGLDLPEVSLVSILDADKEGFLRSARVADPDHRPRGPQRVRPGAHVRRQDHAVDGSRRSTRPTGAARSRSPTTSSTASTRSRCARRSPTSPTCSTARTPTPRRCSAVGPVSQSRGKAPVPRVGRGARRGRREAASGRLASMPAADLADLIQQLTDQMHQAAAELHFELAARLRDEIGDLKKELRQMTAATS